jgi:hypothetical protein
MEARWSSIMVKIVVVLTERASEVGIGGKEGRRTMMSHQQLIFM